MAVNIGLTNLLRKLSLSDATCREPGTLPDADIVQPAGQSASSSRSYNVGDSVTYKCRTGEETLQRTCMSEGEWSPAGYVCSGLLKCRPVSLAYRSARIQSTPRCRSNHQPFHCLFFNCGFLVVFMSPLLTSRLVLPVYPLTGAF